MELFVIEMELNGEKYTFKKRGEDIVHAIDRAVELLARKKGCYESDVKVVDANMYW